MKEKKKHAASLGSRSRSFTNKLKYYNEITGTVFLSVAPQEEISCGNHRGHGHQKRIKDVEKEHLCRFLYNYYKKNDNSITTLCGENGKYRYKSRLDAM